MLALTNLDVKQLNNTSGFFSLDILKALLSQHGSRFRYKIFVIAGDIYNVGLPVLLLY